MKRILIIDDSLVIRKLIRNLLIDEDFEILEAENGLLGCDIYRSEKPDLVLTDIIMPEKDGFEVLRDIYTDFPQAKIIVMSDGGSFKDLNFISMVKRFGAICFLTKPVTKDALLEAIKKSCL